MYITQLKYLTIRFFNNKLITNSKIKILNISYFKFQKNTSRKATIIK